MSIKLKFTSSTKRYISASLSLIISIVAGVTLTWTMAEVFDKNISSDKKSNITQYEKEFFSTTNKLIQNSDSLSINIETIKKIFNSIDRKSNGELFNYGFINVLEDYSVSLIADTVKVNNQNFHLIVGLINEELRGEPFNSLKAEQRRILLNLQKSIKNTDSEIGLYNLNELNDILRIQNEYELNLEKQNSWSIPLAITGIVLSLFFGITSLIKSISKKDNNNAS